MPAKYGLTTAKPAKTFRWLYLPFMLLLGLGSMVLATQRIAAFWSYQPALGKPLFTAFGQPWYAPWSALEWQSRLKVHDAYGFMEQAVTQSGSGHDKVDQKRPNRSVKIRPFFV